MKRISLRFWSLPALTAPYRPLSAGTAAAEIPSQPRVEAPARRSPRALAVLALALCIPAAEATVVRSIPIEGPGPVPDDSGYVRNLMETNGRLLFDGSTGSSGHEPWAFDPETEDAALLADLCPGSCGDFDFLARVGGLAYYSVATDLSGFDRNLLRTDGTPEGTRLLLRGDEQGRLAQFGGGELTMAAGSSLVFRGEDETYGRQLWITDGTEAGTRRVSPFPGTAPTSQVYEIGATDAYAVAVVWIPEENGYQLWTYRLDDGATARVPGAPEQPYRFTLLGDRMIFLGYGVDQDVELWSLEPSSSTATRLTDFAAPDPFAQTGWFEVHGNVAYFLCNDIEHGQELWRSDGSPGGTRAVSDFGYYFPFEYAGGDEVLETFGGAVYFIATDGISSRSLWKSTGAGGQTRVLELCETYCGGLDQLWVVRAGERLYFPRKTAEQGLELWTIAPDGTATLTADRCAGACSADLSAPVATAGSLFLWIGTYADGVKLFSFDDGAPAGIQRSSFENDYPWEIYPYGGDAPDIAAVAGRWFFRAAGDGLNSAIWEVASGTEPMHEVARVRGWGYGSYASGLAGYSGGVLFVRSTGEASEVDRLPPSTDATEPVVQLDAGCNTSPFVAVASDAVALRFCSDEPATLMRIDSAGGFEEISLANLGAGAEFQKVLSTGERAIVPYLLDGRWHLAGLAPSASSPTPLASFSPDLTVWSSSGPVLGAILIAFGNSQSGDDEIWATDGTLAGTRKLLAQPNLIGYGGFGAWDMGGFALFSGLGGDGGRTLWRTDGTAIGTSAHWTSPQYGENIRLAGRLGPQLLFFTLSYNRTSLYATQGQPNDVVPVLQEEGPTPLVIDIPPVSDSAGLYFVVDRLETGREVAITDGTAAGTRVLDLTPGPQGSAVRTLLSSGDAVFAIASTAEYGTEIYRVNTTRAGLTLHVDIAPGAQPALPEQLLVSDGFLFFTADDGLSGSGLWRVSTSAAERQCPSGPSHLCLGEEQFELTAHWRDFWGGIGEATAVDLTSDTGWFWFFDPANVETMVKVLDGRPVNDHHWVFYGALSNVEYWVTVRNAENGTSRRYHNVAGRYASRGDVNAFGPLATSVDPDETPSLSESARALISSSLAEASGTCTPSPTRLCLQQGRFAVEASWRDFQGNTGIGTAVPLSADTGYFWFFWESNVEVILKVLDGRGVNDRFWVYYGALSNVEYTLTVTDTLTGSVKSYFNPAGRFASVGDNDAF